MEYILTRKNNAIPAMTATPTTPPAAIPIIPAVLIPEDGVAVAVADAMADVTLLLTGATIAVVATTIVAGVVCNTVD